MKTPQIEAMAGMTPLGIKPGKEAGERTQMPSQSKMDHAAEVMLAPEFNAWLDECAEQVAAANANGQDCDDCGTVVAKDDLTWHEDSQEHLCPLCERQKQAKAEGRAS